MTNGVGDAVGVWVGRGVRVDVGVRVGVAGSGVAEGVGVTASTILTTMDGAVAVISRNNVFDS